MRVVFGLVAAFFAIGLMLEILGLFGVHISAWTVIFWILVIIAVVKWKTIFRTIDYLFVRHPIDPSVSSDTAGAMPTYRSENALERSQALKDKLDAEAAIAAATLRRERARAALADAEREAEEIARRSEKPR